MDGASREMPRYRCHKEVWALKIQKVSFAKPGNPAAGGTITPADEVYAEFAVDGIYLDRHKPMPGGYYVVYDDGYESYSPAKAFEDGYTRK